ncbi:MAG: YjbF family lipoprotein [Rhodobacteraceae bacterium]|nr:YjbF family lipoprotein [Paracoccaceae bacterium]
MTPLRLLGLAGAAFALLAGCGSDRGGSAGPFASLREVAAPALGAVIAARRARPAAGPAALPRPTREQVDAADREIIFSAVPARGSGATLARIGQNGPVSTYTTADGTTLALAGGVVVGSRGLGEDLMSAAAPSAAAIAAGRGGHERTYYFLGGVDQKRELAIACTLAPGGATRVEVVGLSFPVREVTETCTGSAGTITNRYWFEPGGRIRKSRQWLSPTVGYLEIELLSR